MSTICNLHVAHLYDYLERINYPIGDKIDRKALNMPTVKEFKKSCVSKDGVEKHLAKEQKKLSRMVKCNFHLHVRCRFQSGFPRQTVYRIRWLNRHVKRCVLGCWYRRVATWVACSYKPVTSVMGCWQSRVPPAVPGYASAFPVSLVLPRLEHLRGGDFRLLRVLLHPAVQRIIVDLQLAEVMIVLSNRGHTKKSRSVVANSHIFLFTNLY